MIISLSGLEQINQLGSDQQSKTLHIGEPGWVSQMSSSNLSLWRLAGLSKPPFSLGSNSSGECFSFVLYGTLNFSYLSVMSVMMSKLEQSYPNEAFNGID